MATRNELTVDEAAGPKRLIRPALAALALLGLLAFVWWTYDHQAVMAWMQRAGPLPFFAGLALLPAVGMPLTPFFVIAGATFGVRVGLIGSFIGLGVNLALCYWIARSKLRPWLEGLLRRRFSYDLPDFRTRNSGVLRFALLVKLTPGPPAFVKNYALGGAGVPFAIYFGLSMLVTGVYAVSFVVLGESLFQHDLRRTLIVAAAVLLLAIVVWLVRRRRTQASRGVPTTT